MHRRVIDSLSTGEPRADWVEDPRAYANALRKEYRAHRDGGRMFGGTLITDPAVLRAQEPWLQRLTTEGLTKALAFDAFESVTAFVTGFVIEEQERDGSDDVSRYDPAEREERVGDHAPLTVAAGYARTQTDARFARQLGYLLRGLRSGEVPS